MATTKKKMKKALTITAAALSAAAILLSGCSSKGEQAAAKEEAAQIEAAHIDGREAARAFLGRQFKDSLEIHAELVRAGSRRAHYDSLPRSQAAYDSAFISTIRTVNPALAGELQKHRPQ